MRRFFKIILIFFILSFATTGFAKKAQYLVVPSCLLAKKFPYELIGQAEDLRLIKIDDLGNFQRARIKLPFYCRGFMNVTSEWEESSRHKNQASSFLKSYRPALRPSDFTRSYKIQHKPLVAEIVQRLDAKRVSDNLKVLTNLPDRYVNSSSGVYAAQWIKQELKSMIEACGREDIEVTMLPTKNAAKQASIILKIGKDLQTPGIILGSHIDTIDSAQEYQPGTDDDASGAVTLLEVARVLLESEVVLTKPIYLIWYAGEEVGKLGSQTVVQYFNHERIEVDAVLHLDGVGYAGKEPGIGLMDDFTDAGLTVFVADLIDTYVKLPVGAVRCGYACSDHFTWYQNGNRVAYPFANMDDEGNPKAHTRKDTIDAVSINHIMDFVKLSLAFAVELAAKN